MNIAVQINSNLSDQDIVRDINYRLFNQASSLSFLSDKKNDSCLLNDSTTKHVALTPIISNSISAGIWYQFSLNSFLKKNKVDVFVSNSHYCNLKHHSKQIIHISNDDFV
jgi:hypothetical protein